MATKRKADYADDFAVAWRAFAPSGAPEPVREYRFAAEHVGGGGRGVRRRLAAARLKDWRFDFAFVDGTRLAVEIDGGQWMAGGGRHNGDDDREKGNAAAKLGWRVMHYSPRMLEEPVRCVLEVCAALEGSER